MSWYWYLIILYCGGLIIYHTYKQRQKIIDYFINFDYFYIVAIIGILCLGYILYFIITNCENKNESTNFEELSYREASVIYDSLSVKFNIHGNMYYHKTNDNGQYMNRLFLMIDNNKLELISELYIPGNINLKHNSVKIDIYENDKNIYSYVMKEGKTDINRYRIIDKYISEHQFYDYDKYKNVINTIIKNKNNTVYVTFINQNTNLYHKYLLTKEEIVALKESIEFYKILKYFQ